MKPADASLVLAPLFDRYAETLGVNPEGAAAVVVRDDKGRETLYVACRKGIVWVSHDQSAEMGLVLWSAVGCRRDRGNRDERRRPGLRARPSNQADQPGRDPWQEERSGPGPRFHQGRPREPGRQVGRLPGAFSERRRPRPRQTFVIDFHCFSRSAMSSARCRSSPSVQDAHVVGLGAPVDPGRPRVDPGSRVRTRREVAGRAIGRLDPDLARPVQLRRVRVPWPFALPVVEDARRSFRSFAASLQYLADSLPSSCHERPATSRPPSRSREIRRRLTADGSRALRSDREYCHQRPSIRARRPWSSIALRSFWLTIFISAAVVASS